MGVLKKGRIFTKEGVVGGAHDIVKGPRSTPFLFITGSIKLFVFYKSSFRNMNSPVCMKNVMLTAHFVRDTENAENSNFFIYRDSSPPLRATQAWRAEDVK